MDCTKRVYYLVNLNQNHNRSGWWTRGWDNFGHHYETNFKKLKTKVPSLKVTSNNQLKYPEYEYYQMKVSCKKDEELVLVATLNELEDANYIRIG